jgi:hypothetical protein
MALTEAQKRAKKKYAEKVASDPAKKERQKYLSAKRQASHFVDKWATAEDLKELAELIKQKH